jgi:hypothetical protein
MKSRFVLTLAALAVASPAFASDRGLQKSFHTPGERNIPSVGVFANRPSGEAVHTFPSFTEVVAQTSTTTLTPVFRPLPGAPAGVYTSFSVTMDWGNSVNDAWSNEAIWAMTDAASIAPGTTFYADPGTSPDSAGNSLPRPLTWNGFMDEPYTGGDPLTFVMAQTFGPSSATWSNVSITIGDDLPVAPGAVQTFLGDGNVGADVVAGDILWYAFDYSGVGEVYLSTLGTAIEDDTFPNDTEMGLYSATGALIASNDDIDFASDIFESELFFGEGELPAGTYYLATGAWGLTFGPAFGVTQSAVSASGFVNVTGLVIPEPATLGLLAGVTLLGLRRR